MRRAAITSASNAIGTPPTESTLFAPNFFYQARAMLKVIKANLSITGLVFIVASTCPCLPVRADEPVEKAGVAVGLTAGNMVVIPAKAISMSMGMLFGAVSFIVTGGNLNLTKQIWQDTTQGPYLVTPDLAKKSIGERPELMRPKTEPMERQ